MQAFGQVPEERERGRGRGRGREGAHREWEGEETLQEVRLTRA